MIMYCYYYYKLKTHHIQSPFLVEKSRNGERCDAARHQRQVRVDHSTLSRVAVRKCAVEARPVQPQEDGADHREQVRVVGRALVLTAGMFRVVQDSRSGETEVSAEHVHEHGAADVGRLK